MIYRTTDRLLNRVILFINTTVPPIIALLGIFWACVWVYKAWRGL